MGINEGVLSDFRLRILFCLVIICLYGGVYAVRAHFKNQPSKTGVANVGIRPTVGGDRVLLETHLFDFDGDIYGCRIEIEFVSKIRNEKKFESFQQLKDQIEHDAAAARAWFEINS